MIILAKSAATMEFKQKAGHIMLTSARLDIHLKNQLLMFPIHFNIMFRTPN